jgi:hypothetical protein
MMQKLVAIAAAEVGVREVGSNNSGPRVREYQKATWLEPAAWPWCAAFVCWTLREWLRDPAVVAVLGVAKPDAWRCKDASAFGWEKWARVKGLTVLPETAKARAGDIVIFDFSHIGIVELDQVGRVICTIEGNTNGAGARDSESGDGVWRKTRAQSLVKSYVRLLTEV